VIQVLFFLRFRTQLQKTRQDSLVNVESGLVKAFEAANGTVHIKERRITASFDEKSLGIWLNIISVLETGRDLLEKNCSVPTGAYAFVVCKDTPVFEMENVCRMLASQHGGSGIWCDLEMKKTLSSYCIFENDKIAVRAGSMGNYVQIKCIEAISRSVRRSAGAFPLSDKIVRFIKQDAGKNIVFSGPDFIGKREGVYRFCSLGSVAPPLILRFHRAGEYGDGSAIAAFADTLSPKIYTYLSAGNDASAASDLQKRLEILDALKRLIFRERLRDECSPALAGIIKRFFRMLVELYVAKAKKKKERPVIALENLHNADVLARDIFLEAYSEVKFDVTVYGTCTEKKDKSVFLNRWEAVFSKNIALDYNTDAPLINFREMSGDLWELAYTFNLLRNFFPGHQFLRLFEETGRTPSILVRIFAQLARIGVIDCIDDPIPRIPNFTVVAERFLGDRKDVACGFVKTCLLQAISRGKISACFSLIEALAGLCADISDTLLWSALYSDILNGTTTKIRLFIIQNRFDGIAGKEHGPAARHLFSTFNALMHGDKKDVQEAFSADAPDTASALYQMEILINRACYYVGSRQQARAFETLKKVLRINHDQRKTSPAKVFRLIALGKLQGGKWNEAMEYISIAVEHAEKQGVTDELAICSYYAANIHYLIGDLSKAERLVRDAEHNAIVAGCGGWTDRVRFLRGRLRFEFGFYQDALHVFEKTFENLSEPVTDAMKNTMNAWIFRAKFFSNFTAAKPDAMSLPDADGGASVGADSSNLETLLFKVEASYLAGDYKKTLELSETMTKFIPNEDFLWTERPDWSNGFAQTELLNMSQRDFWGRKASIFHSLALSKFSENADDKKQAVKDIGWLTRGEVPPCADTCDFFYFYALYRVLREADASLVDINTVVGTAFRRLQQRSLKIDDTESRRGFLNRPYWNSALIHTAKEYMLV
jgi:tetratricopeptide (TPR) repeat protein